MCADLRNESVKVDARLKGNRTQVKRGEKVVSESGERFPWFISHWVDLYQGVGSGKAELNTQM